AAFSLIHRRYSQFRYTLTVYIESSRAELSNVSLLPPTIIMVCFESLQAALSKPPPSNPNNDGTYRELSTTAIIRARRIHTVDMHSHTRYFRARLSNGCKLPLSPGLCIFLASLWVSVVSSVGLFSRQTGWGYRIPAGLAQGKGG
ncbi:hypothetical protein SCHPADRAFT_897586, partial [Schizopora paradoxa]